MGQKYSVSADRAGRTTRGVRLELARYDSKGPSEGAQAGESFLMETQAAVAAMTALMPSASRDSTASSSSAMVRTVLRCLPMICRAVS
jgi:hypothetical protein